jgi:hypothetical protein
MMKKLTNSLALFLVFITAGSLGLKAQESQSALSNDIKGWTDAQFTLEDFQELKTADVYTFKLNAKDGKLDTYLDQLEAMYLHGTGMTSLEVNRANAAITVTVNESDASHSEYASTLIQKLELYLDRQAWLEKTGQIDRELLRARDAAFQLRNQSTK